MTTRNILSATALVACLATSAFAADGHDTLGKTGGFQGWGVFTTTGKTYSVYASPGLTKPYVRAKIDGVLVKRYVTIRSRQTKPWSLRYLAKSSSAGTDLSGGYYGDGCSGNSSTC